MHGLALTSAHNRGSSRWKLSELNTEVFRRLGEIRREKRTEASRVAGSKAQWRELDMEFRIMVRGLSERRFIPEVLRESFAQFEPNGSLSDPGRQATPSAVRLADGSRCRCTRN